ncbi:MAG: hypothetical protein ACYCV4_10775 [Dermatophilaceae bacterium]
MLELPDVLMHLAGRAHGRDVLDVSPAGTHLPTHHHPHRADATGAAGAAGAALSTKANVERYLSLNGITLGESSRIVMLANARVLDHVFDPWSVSSSANP